MKRRLILIGKLLLRFALGLMWFISGISWFSRDAAAYLSGSLTSALNTESTLGFYRPFLEGVVLESQALFSVLVSLGEFLVGLSFLSGAMVRFSAGVSLFLLLNYSFMNGSLYSPYNLFFLALHVMVFLSRPGRTWGLDGLLHKRWPGNRLF